ncbi:amidophosphoribosyltransferase [candidate division LCP-89 bacterium B3_LCP]|uniref:Amidophosphoribosyltransferase n=1 Tax=candidate division LCP-89 bacterium B3_LCP TaxID=2012998 RepID=A0A532V1S8_UNCL8|nr:MAG: amidophosphoribosyltransferase [candidate division LCP-89 bacterium B3_LCP]
MSQPSGKKEFCGIFAVFNSPNAAEMTFMGLHALQHRGQESTGIVSSDGENLYRHADLGLVADVFANPHNLKKLKGHLAIGHNRYSTTGSTSVANTQPMAINYHGGALALAHNGNLVNSGSLRQQLERAGSIFSSSADSEVILHLLARSRKSDLIGQLRDALGQIEGAYALVILTEDSIIAVRDPHGFRPLCMGSKDGTVVFASESCALDLVEATYIRDVDAGEIVVVSEDGVKSHHLPPVDSVTQCIFEFIYFSRPDSRIFGEYVDKTRRKLGKVLAEESPTPGADIVISVPDSSNTAALGYAQKAGLPYELALIRNHYIGRTFIHPSQVMRDYNVRVKFNTVGGVLRGRSVVVVDDSIVRGTTLKKLTSLIRHAGASEVHLRISSPPIRYPCFFGMDFPTSKELVASHKDVEEVRSFLGVDSLNYLSIEGLLRAVPVGRCGYCTCCFTGDYPVEIKEACDKHLLEHTTHIMELEFKDDKE